MFVVRITAPMVALAALAGAGCSLLAPSDDELMPPPASTGSGAAGEGGSAGAGGAAASGGGIVSGTGGFCGDRAMQDPSARFCEDFDDAETALGLQTWTGTPGSPHGSAELVSDPHQSAPSAALVRLEQRTGCYHAQLDRRVSGTTTDPQAPPRTLHLHMALAANEDGFFGQMELEACVALATVQGGGTSLGFEFQWGTGAAYVDYPVELTVFGRMPSIQWDIDLEAGTTAVAIDGQPLVPDQPFEVPMECRLPTVPMTFSIGLLCQDAGTVVIDDVVFGTD